MQFLPWGFVPGQRVKGIYSSLQNGSRWGKLMGAPAVVITIWENPLYDIRYTAYVYHNNIEMYTNLLLYEVKMKWHRFTLWWTSTLYMQFILFLCLKPITDCCSRSTALLEKVVVIRWWCTLQPHTAFPFPWGLLSKPIAINILYAYRLIFSAWKIQHPLPHF